MKNINKYSPPIPHLLQAQQALALLYAKVAGRPGTGSYPAPSPSPTTQVWKWSNKTIGCLGPLWCYFWSSHFGNHVKHLWNNLIVLPCRITNSFEVPCLSPAFEPRHDKTNKMSVRPAKTQISLGIRPVWSESSLCAQWVAKNPSFLHVDSEDSN